MIGDNRLGAALEHDALDRLNVDGPAIQYLADFRAGEPHWRWVSASAAQILGHPPAQLRQASWWRKHLHPDDEAWFRAGTAPPEEPTERVWLYRLKAADGRYRWIRDRQRVVPGRDRDQPDLLGVAADVTAEIEAMAQADTALEHLVRAVDGLSELIIIYDAQDRLIFANPAADAFNCAVGRFWAIGVRFEDFLRAGVAGGLFPDAVGQEEAWIKERLACHRNPSGAFEVARQGDRTLLVREQVMDDGCIFTISTDITERKQAERALVQSEERFRGLIEGSLEGVIVHRNRKALFANQAFADLLGYGSPADILALPSIDVYVAPDEIERIRSYARARLRGDPAPISYEFRAKRKDGEILWLNCRPIVVDWDGAPAIKSVMFDVTDLVMARLQRDEAEARLRVAHDLLTDALESLPTAFALFDKNDALVLYNSNYPKLTPVNVDLVKKGVKFETLVRAGIERGHSLYEGDSIDQIVADRVARHRAGGSFERKRADGTWLLVNERPSRDGGTIIVETDITQQKRAEHVLASQKALLESLATNTPLDELLERLVRDTEDLLPDTLCSILLIDEEGTHLRHGAAPSLPDFYNNEIDGLEVGPTAGSCGTAAYTGRRVIVEDIKASPLWADWREVAGRADLRACWSQPIKAASGKVLGVFALYYRAPRHPDADAIAFMESAAHLAAVAIEKRHTEAALQKSEERFRDFAHAFGERMWETDTHHRYTFITGDMQNAFPIDSLLGLNRWQLPGIDPSDPIWPEHRAAMDRQEPIRGFRYRWRNATGETRVLEVNGKPIYGQDGAWLGYRGVVTDVTTEIEAMAQARTDRERLALAVENLSELFTLCDADDRIVSANRAWREINKEIIEFSGPGARYEDHLRAGLRVGLFADAVGREEEWLTQRMAARRRADGPIELGRQGGRWLLVNDERLPDGGLITIALDITDRREAQIALEEAKQQAEAANQAKLRFLATMSHELRTPLNAIIGYADLVRLGVGRGDDPDKLKDHARSIKEAGNHLLELINDILDISKIEVGKFTLSDDLVSLDRTAETCLRLLAARARDGGVALKFDAPADLPLLVADARRVKQMLLNLLSNAINHTREGGVVAISAGRLIKGGGLFLEVEDSGVGIDPKDFPKALEPFVQLDSGLGRRQGGTGLGLALTKELAELHGGELTLSSEPGVGTRVRITFPARRIAPAVDAAQA